MMALVGGKSTDLISLRVWRQGGGIAGISM